VTGPGNGGGAIATGGGVSIGTSASPLASVTFTGNSAADFFGGAINAPSPSGGNVNIFRDAVTLSGNASGRGGGGGVFAQGEIPKTGNTITTASNTAVGFGGSTKQKNNITISGNSIAMANNAVTSTTPGEGSGGGGAIPLGGPGPGPADLLINGNEVIFSDNR